MQLVKLGSLTPESLFCHQLTVSTSPIKAWLRGEGDGLSKACGSLLIVYFLYRGPLRTQLLGIECGWIPQGWKVVRR